MKQLELVDPRATTVPYKNARLIEFWCAEPIFFASREVSDTYYTEGSIGNYALAYALGWARSHIDFWVKRQDDPHTLKTLHL